MFKYHSANKIILSLNYSVVGLFSVVNFQVLNENYVRLHCPTRLGC